jgi:hypothetical protein
VRKWIFLWPLAGLQGFRIELDTGFLGVNAIAAFTLLSLIIGTSELRLKPDLRSPSLPMFLFRCKYAKR